ncbi:hypothetical protein CEY12_00525 [Chryseobacterium sp. T16E-39]|uniref:DUF1203 domain-containing protein n=1 Tax=Chryseobacterium sp. T16E-39 TaxID=2015076 RepID=UPI000B5B32A1|nr:DUF1203 domain-containing protein [Chryseobacterium sp. T16E-39]ASK28685.1 hypothetical protein CEY12_00525 [Chryseobacterium sp. T16E-39]
MTNFRFEALNDVDFAYLNDLSETELSEKNIRKLKVDKFPGFPCRVTLEDAKVDEHVFLLNYDFHKADSPYKASGPIFIRANKATRIYEINEVPTMFNHRLLSIRGYTKEGIMLFADVFEGKLLKEKIPVIFENPDIQYIHIHNAKPGCFGCAVARA